MGLFHEKKLKDWKMVGGYSCLLLWMAVFQGSSSELAYISTKVKCSGLHLMTATMTYNYVIFKRGN